jgi:hypothetical protein
MTGELHQRLLQIAADTNTPLVDAQQLLMDCSPDGIPGNDVYVDHVHPSISSHQHIARTLAAKLEKMSLVAGDRKWQDEQRRPVYRRHFRQLGLAYMANGRRRLAWLEGWARRHKLDSEVLPKDARSRLRFGQRQLEFGHSTGHYSYNLAWEQFQLAMKEKPHLSREVLDQALRLFRDGRGDLAEEILLRLHDEPEAAELRPQTELALLVIAVDDGRTAEAEAICRRCRAGVEQAAHSSRGWIDVLPNALDQLKSQTENRSSRPAAGQ